jgi:hypothetical protein
MSEDSPQGGLEKSIEALRRSGADAEAISVSLQLQLLSDLGITNERLVSAERQRHSLLVKIERLLEEQAVVKGLIADVEELKVETRKNSEFRQQFIGGGIAMKLFWLFGGGVILLMIQKFWGKL